MSKDYIWLKWGTYKENEYSTVRQFAALKRYTDGGVTMGAMDQVNTPDQIEALCELIDAIAENGGDIIDAWTMESMTVDDAKAYVRSGGR